MLRIQQYQKVKSVEEAYELLQKNRNNQIIAGMLWLKMEDRTIPVGIDLSLLPLNQIVEDEECFKIGANVTLRELETHITLNECTCNVIKDSVKEIVGVQFRNMATIGGSIYSRFGFSDILCALLCLDCDVVLHHGGIIPLHTFVNMPYKRDVLTHIIIRKTKLKSAFVCVRKSATDLSVLNVSASKVANAYRICVGARPQKAMLFNVENDDKEMIAKFVMEQTPCESNMRASKEYRTKLVYALTLKALEKIGE